MTMWVRTLDQQPYRILHVFGIMNRGGAESFAMDVYRHLDRSVVQFDFVVHSNEAGHFDREIRDLGGRIFVLPSPNQAGAAKYKRELAEVLAKQGPFRGVHSQVYYFSGLVLQVAEACGIPVRIANSNSIQDGRRGSWLRKLYRWYMKSLIIKHSTHLLGVSQEACRSLFGKDCFHSLNKVSVIPNAVNLEKYRFLPQDKAILRNKLSLPATSPIVGHVGRFNAPKNHKFLIEVFAALHQFVPQAQFVLAGDGPLREEIEGLIKERGLEEHVHLLGVREDVPEILGALDVFVFPSLYEGLGLSLVEAQAAGIPSVISNTIPSDVDLGLGLIKAMSLHESPSVWADEIMRRFHHDKQSWETVERHIRDRNYEISELSLKLQSLYTG